MPYPPENPPHVFSILAGREVATWSDEWKHECEVRMVAANMPLVQRNEVLDEPQKGMKAKRGETAVARMRADIDRYADLRRIS